MHISFLRDNIRTRSSAQSMQVRVCLAVEGTDILVEFQVTRLICMICFMFLSPTKFLCIVISKQKYSTLNGNVQFLSLCLFGIIDIVFHDRKTWLAINDSI